METTEFKPPIEIFKVLHDAEAAGVMIPKIVDKWWELETVALSEAMSKNKEG